MDGEKGFSVMSVTISQKTLRQNPQNLNLNNRNAQHR
jgi:hypothetical protein